MFRQIAAADDDTEATKIETGVEISNFWTRVKLGDRSVTSIGVARILSGVHFFLPKKLTSFF